MNKVCIFAAKLVIVKCCASAVYYLGIWIQRVFIINHTVQVVFEENA